MSGFRMLALIGLLLGALSGEFVTRPGVVAADDCALFPETGYTVCGQFLWYWQEHGGLAQQGLPLSQPFTEVSALDHQPYTMQYFERAVFEYHPENQATNADYTILLSQLGREALAQRYPQGTPAALPQIGECSAFAQTGKQICGRFLTYWQEHGGLAQQGLPLSDVFLEQASDGKVYPVQYFERAVFEYHQELASPNDVLLSQLGRQRFNALYPGGPPGADYPGVSLGRFTFQTVGTSYVAWSVPVHNTSGQPILAVTVTVIFLDGNNQVLDRSLAGGAKLEVDETRVIMGVSVLGLGYAKYRVEPPEVTYRP